MPNQNWAVFRQDFTGNNFLVEQHLTEERARELVIEYESHKHHQHYWTCEIPESEVDYAEMLRALLNSGSPLDASLTVLRNQNASMTQCIRAVREVKNIDLAESKRVVLNSTAFRDQHDLQESLIEQIKSEFPDEP